MKAFFAVILVCLVLGCAHSSISDVANAQRNPSRSIASVPEINTISLINANNAQVIGEIANGQTIYLSTLPTQNLSMAANTSTSTASVKSVLTYPGGKYTHSENTQPFSLCGDTVSAYTPCTQMNILGSHTITVTPYSGINDTGAAGEAFTLTFTIAQAVATPTFVVKSFSLVDASTAKVIAGFDPIATGATINLNAISTKNLSIRANVSGTVASVGFTMTNLDGTYSHVENTPPYSLCGDATTSFDICSQLDSAGSFTLKGTAYSGANLTGNAGGSAVVNFTVTTAVTPPSTGAVVKSFTLINNSTGTAIAGFNPVANNAVIDLISIGTSNVSIRANTSPSAVGSVGVLIDGNYTHLENTAPYDLCAANARSHDCTVLFANGAHSLKATAYSGTNFTGTSGPGYSIGFVVTGASASTISVSGVAGAFVHKKSFMISGVNFGTKTTAAPYVWDDATGTSLSQKWDFSDPTANDAAYRIGYRTPSQVTLQNGVGGIALPHSHATKYIAGAHYNSVLPVSNSGYDVSAGKNNQQGNAYTYITFYRAADPHWVTNQPIGSCPSANCKCDLSTTTGKEDCDHNFKEYVYAPGQGSYGNGKQVIYGAHGPNMSPLASVEFDLNYALSTIGTIYSVGSTQHWYPSSGSMFSSFHVNGPAMGWQRIELILKHRSLDGFHHVLINNQTVWDTNLNDDVFGAPADAREENVFGGYCREYGSDPVYKNNWRYYADVYYDHSLARVMLANNSTYELATILEPQLPTAWSTNSITVTTNLGRFTSGQKAYVFIFDANNNHNAVGYPVTITGP